MIQVTHAFLAIIALFFILLLIKKVSGLRFCVICLSFTVTWIGLLAAYFLNLFDSLVLIAIMAGMTLHGLYEMLEDKVQRKYEVFRLPALLTGLIVFYTGLTRSIDAQYIIIVAALWLIFALLFLYRENSRFEGFVDEIIECCRDW